MVIPVGQLGKQNHPWPCLSCRKLVPNLFIPSCYVLKQSSSFPLIFLYQLCLFFFYCNFAFFQSFLTQWKRSNFLTVVRVSSEEGILFTGICLDVPAWGQLDHLRQRSVIGIWHQSRERAGQIEGKPFLAAENMPKRREKVTVIQ